MATEEEQTQQNQIMTSNAAYVNNFPFMIMRLDTSGLIEKIENFLSSRRIVMKMDEETKTWQQKVDQVGLPLANPEGIMRLCNIIEMRVNHHLAQGNFDKEHYWEFIGRARKEIVETVINKCYDWEVHDSNLNMIIDEISALIEGFMTRPIDNKERDSYGQTFQGRDTTVVQTPKQNNSMAQFTGGMGQR